MNELIESLTLPLTILAWVLIVFLCLYVTGLFLCGLVLLHNWLRERW